MGGDRNDIYPSQAFPLIDKIKKRCSKYLLQHGILDPVKVGKIVLMLGIFASKA